MAAPTDVRVEAESLTTTRLRWTYPGASAITVYRSTGGVTYTAITAISVGTTEYEDIGLAFGTKYWYKLSDDNGSTFSSVVTVYTHACGVDANGKGTEITLPRETEEQVSSETFNSLATVVEQGLVRFVAPDGRTCVACISDGALVIDCVDFDGCNVIEVVVDQDINSISLPNCADKEASIEFLVPPNVTRKIGGWPRGIGFTGDEGFRAPVVGGTAGRSINEDIRRGFNLNTRSGKSKSGDATAGTNQGGGSRNIGSCTCTPTSSGGMRIVACTGSGGTNPGNSLRCSDATKLARLLVCGGRGPYTWSRTGTVQLQGATDASAGSTANGSEIKVTPPTNAGSATVGVAYAVSTKNCYWFGAGAGNCGPGGGSAIFNNYSWVERGCDDELETGCQGVDDNGLNYANCNSGRPASLPCIAGTCAGVCTSGGCTTAAFFSGGSPCVNDPSLAGGTMCDRRSAGMISANCVPCGLNAGATITVTDATGASVSIVMTA